MVNWPTTRTGDYKFPVVFRPHRDHPYPTRVVVRQVHRGPKFSLVNAQFPHRDFTG